MKNDIAENQKRKIRAALMIGGTGLILAGMFALAMPQIGTDFTGIESGTIRMIGGGFFMVGLTDVILANTIFSKNTKIDP